MSFWLHPLRPLPKDGTRGADAVWEVKLEGRGGWRAHHKIINLDSFCRFKIIPTGINYLCVKTKHACKYSAAHLTGQEFPSINQRSKRRERIKVRHSFAGQASRTSEKKQCKNQHASPIFNSYTFLTAYIGFCLSHSTQFPLLYSLQSPQPSCPAQKFYTILPALSVHPFFNMTTHSPQLSCFLLLTFFLSPFIFSQALLCLLFFATTPFFSAYNSPFCPEHQSLLKQSLHFLPLPCQCRTGYVGALT